MSGDPATQHDQHEEAAKPDTHDEPEKAIEGTGLGAKVKIPWEWAVFVGPYMKYPIIAFSAGLLAIMVFYAISLVMKK